MLTLALTLGCARIAQLLPEGPVVTPWERQRLFNGRGSGAVYEGDPHVRFPVLPLMVWGVSYDLDLVIVDKDPWWDMHEYARVQMPDGAHWLAKDARLGTLEQVLVSDVAGVETFLPELPARRRAGAIDVADRSTETTIDVTLSYTNFDGQPTRVRFTGAPPTKPQSKRNGSTMGHSRNSVLAVLDLPWQALGHADVEIAGERWPLDRIAGLVPFALSLVQTQGGFATTSLVQRPAEGGMAVAFTLPGGAVADTDWVSGRAGRVLHLRQVTAFRTLDYAYVEQDGNLELASMEVRQWGKGAATCHIDLSPRLPDLRRRFSGTLVSRYVIDIGTGEGHAVGSLEATWTADGPQVRMIPESPWWTADRPMITTVRFPGDGTAQVNIVRVPTDARTGLGGKGTSGVQDLR